MQERENISKDGNLEDGVAAECGLNGKFFSLEMYLVICYDVYM